MSAPHLPPHSPSNGHDPNTLGDNVLEDRLDALVAEFSDLLAAGKGPKKQAFLERVPASARPGLERCLKMIEAGLATAPGAAVPLAPGLALGRYRLVRELGRGGMALVWLAQDSELRRPVALKILRPGLALEQSHIDRFRREAHAIAKLRHASIVQIHDVGSARGFHYLAMEYVEGPSLARVLEALGPSQKRRFSAEELARATGVAALAPRERTLEQALAALLVPVAQALQTAHEHGVVHRDVKPSNILLRKDGTPVVVDFGLAKSAGDPALSITGDTLGTPYYMSPEQAWLAGTKVDHRTDVYSLGVCLYEALTGVRPFEGGSVLEVFEKIKNTLPPAPDSIEPRISEDGASVLRKAMARGVEQRYAAAHELGADLLALATGAPTQARAQAGGRLRRFLGSYGVYASGLPYEYRSHRTFLGLPLVHIINGPRSPGQAQRVARGWFASSPEVALGGLAFGARAYGLFACGSIACGLFTWGGLSLGLLIGFGGLATGTVALGGLSAGYLALGGCALGYGAIGGLAIGQYALGGAALGTHRISNEHRDLSERQFFEAVLGFDLPWLHLLREP